MRSFIVATAALLLSLAVAACSSNTPSTPKQGNGAASPTGGAAPTMGAPAGPQVPQGAEFTIYCATLTGPNHALQARTLKSQLEQLPPLKGMKDWYIVHSADQSVLYYGFYGNVFDPQKPAEGRRARDDRQRLASMIDRASGERIFPLCGMRPLDRGDPAAPPEFDLRNAKGFWSVQIAAYKDSPERKAAAVEAVAKARKDGIEAYFYHGEMVSSVCIGAWPREALKEQETDSVRPDAANQTLFYLPASVRVPSGNIVMPDGQPAKVMQQRVEVLDPGMKAVLAKYPIHILNGDRKTGYYTHAGPGKREFVADPSFVVPIPSQESSPRRIQPTVTDPGAVPDLGRPPPAGGRLRSIGD